MKYCLLIIILFLSLISFTQSPHLSILVAMDSLKANGTRYKIDMKICEIKKSKRGQWFTHDTSKINFATLKSGDIKCGEYFDNGKPTLISGKEEKVFNQFEYTNQFFAWEHILVYRISNMSSRGRIPGMYIVVPIKYKSFITRIDLTGIEFQEGKVVFINDYYAAYDESKLCIKHSFENDKGDDIKSFPLKFLLGEK